MSGRILVATTSRILRQLRHDHRSMAMVVALPLVLLTIVYYMWENQPQFDRIALVLLGVFPFLIMFLLTNIAVLRERSSGTLERLFTTPVSKLDILFAYGIAFGLAAAAQSLIAVVFAHWVLNMQVAGSLGLIVLIAFANAVLGVSLGLLCSAFARTEFQAAQFVPLVVFPQMLLCGLFVPRDQMAGWLETISSVLPMTYSVGALNEVGLHTQPTPTLWGDLTVVVVAIIAALVLGALTLRRRTP
ncbi:MAG: ABC transporter permease [Nocardioidaceae bacterium]|nr:MAG: ABC transporter permease [Nocardioidaceae bacterium]